VEGVEALEPAGARGVPDEEDPPAARVEAAEDVLPDRGAEAVRRVDEHDRRVTHAEERRVAAVTVEQRLEVGGDAGAAAGPELAGLVVRREPEPRAARRGEERGERLPPRSRVPPGDDEAVEPGGSRRVEEV
jgi:hypothetical protein